MAIIINIDVMLAKRKMSVTELSEKVGITMANISILKNGKAKNGSRRGSTLLAQAELKALFRANCSALGRVALAAPWALSNKRPWESSR